MDADTLYLKRVSQLQELSHTYDEIDLVDIASRIRQLFFDNRSLVDTVNSALKIKLKFEVGTFPPGWGPDDDPHWESVSYMSLQDAIDTPMLTLSRDEIGKHVIAFSNGQKITIKEMVTFNANKLGGVHLDLKPHDDYLHLEPLKHLAIGGLPAVSRELKAIARVIIKGLEPLTAIIASRGGASP